MPPEVLGAVDGPYPDDGIGIVAPFDFALDRELWRWVPAGVTLHTTRVPFVPVPVTVEMATMISDEQAVHAATRDLLTPGPKVIAYACTSGSFVNGLVGERALTTIMLEAGAPAAVTTSGALVEALRLLGVGRVAVATPYIGPINERLDSYLAEHGIEVASCCGLGLLDQIWKVPYREVVDIVCAADRPEAEAMFVSCTNLPTYDIIPLLERILGKPVLTANQVTMWAALRLLDREAVAPEQLLLRQTRLPAA
ncbi:maleate cis-trans isomerase family protein [Actinoalloteichus hymeniacidonis]|uniref:Maleate cis-trans isomerase n=1 Tax=Actinoalloteichus hymeniacidonis TaxID=340345 RepID=A0AAC9HPN2_9PSEU|nr:Asp/Glu racemase [Actinoalloteichus hymeniacidonis]AOS63008.1 maleate cis-trans isomerase [Actinoalloteichus hymeniacidonis]MBB5908957.1 maleate isomerase [Actinoalloteichus hymeniacidonis]